MTKKKADKRILKNRKEAWSYLQKSGVKVSQSKLYEDADKGLLAFRKDGTVLRSAVDRYYEDHLAEKFPSTAKATKVQLEKKMLELKRLANVIRKQDFEHARELGQYLPRSEFEKEMAARATALDIGLRDVFLTLVPEFIDLVDGDQRRVPDVLEMLNQALDEKLSEYARVGKFKVLLECA